MENLFAVVVIWKDKLNMSEKLSGKVAFIHYIIQILVRNSAFQAKNRGWVLCPEDLYESFVLS